MNNQNAFDFFLKSFPHEATVYKARKTLCKAHYDVSNEDIKMFMAKGMYFKDSAKGSKRYYRDIYSLEKPSLNETIKETFKMKDTTLVEQNEIKIPELSSSYVSWGFFSDLTKILKSKMFFPVYIGGVSGNGKTMMCMQAAAKAKRKLIRVQITPETDESDLIGGFRLVNGDTVFEEGPAIKAMKEGAILLLDEIDRGTNKIMCLQGIAEGSPYYVKKINKVITPKEGFQILATANTKGRGCDDGRYSAASIIDDAFLERFPATVTQPFPSNGVESKILAAHFMSYTGETNDTLTEYLMQWSHNIRKVYEEDAISDVISTRRLCHIIQTYSIFGDLKKAVSMCISRYEEETKQSMMVLLDAVIPKETDEDPKKAMDSFFEDIENPFIDTPQSRAAKAKPRTLDANYPF